MFKRIWQSVKASATTASAKIAAVPPQPRHRCGPDPWRCNCARRREINAGSPRGERPWIDLSKWRL